MNAQWVKHIFEASADRLALIFGSLFLLLSVLRVSHPEGKLTVDVVGRPSLWLFPVGLGLLGAFVWLTSRARLQKVSARRIEKGYRILVGTSLRVDVVTGAIEHADPLGDHSAIVLPANTTFDDECIKDKESSLGAFFQKHFPEGISQIHAMIRAEACRTLGEAPENFREAPEGTTIFLDKPLGSSYKIFITAVTTASPGSAIKADTPSLIAAIKSVCRLAAQHRISHLYMPVLGTGHGGLDFSSALAFLLVQVANCVRREGTHHIGELTVLVYDPEGRKAGLVDRVVHSVIGILEGD